MRVRTISIENTRAVTGGSYGKGICVNQTGGKQVEGRTKSKKTKKRLEPTLLLTMIAKRCAQ